jgi:hypothetical protein
MESLVPLTKFPSLASSEKLRQLEYERSFCITHQHAKNGMGWADAYSKDIKPGLVHSPI